MIRPAREGDTEQILELLAAALGGERRREVFEWKHHSNPFGDSVLLVAEDSGRILGLRAFLRWEWRWNGQVVRAARAVDTATHPTARRQGLFSRLTRAGLEALENDGVAFVFNTPNRYSRPGYLKLGWTVAGRVRLWIKPLRPLRVAVGLVTRRAGPGPALDGFERAADLAADDLPADSASDPARLATGRSAAYLAWRYGTAPESDYRVLRAEAGGRRAALVLSGRARRGLREVKVCELLGPGDLLAPLLSRLAESVEADYLVAAAPRGTPQASLLRHAGYRSPPTVGPVLTVRALGTRRRPDLEAERSWGYSLGDLELF